MDRRVEYVPQHERDPYEPTPDVKESWLVRIVEATGQVAKELGPFESLSQAMAEAERVAPEPAKRAKRTIESWQS